MTLITSVAHCFSKSSWHKSHLHNCTYTLLSESDCNKINKTKHVDSRLLYPGHKLHGASLRIFSDSYEKNFLP